MNKTNYKKYFKGKKITIMGLGLLGRGIGYTKFLAQCGADLTVTDLKTAEQLKPALKQLSKYKNIKYVLGEHKLEDFRNKDLIMKAAGVPLDSIYIKEAQKNNIPIKMDASLFAELAPSVKIIGVTGTRGKSMTTMIIYEVLANYLKNKKTKVYLGGNIRGHATLPLLQKVKDGDIVVLELDSWQLQGFGDAKISPNISVFTSFMRDHMNYYKDDVEKYFADKANIFKYQKEGDTLVIRPDMKVLIQKEIKKIPNFKNKLIIADSKKVDNYNFIVPGKYQKENLSAAVEVAKLFKIPESQIKKSVKNFKGVEGRLQYVKTVKGVKIYNDNNATTPEATVACLEALGSKNKDLVLLCGGADKNIDLKILVKSIEKHCKYVVFLDGSGTQKLLNNFKLKTKYEVVSDLKQACSSSFLQAKKGDTVVLSPAFASFGMFVNEYDRNDQFMKITKKLK